MALPSSGNSISLQQVNVELGNTGTDAINMGSSAVRGLFGVSSGAIDMSDGFGKSNAPPDPITYTTAGSTATTIDASVRAIGVQIIGGGGGGCSAQGNAGAFFGTGGGGAGGNIIAYFNVSGGETLTAVRGAAGAGGVATNGLGQNGSASSVTVGSTC